MIFSDVALVGYGLLKAIFCEVSKVDQHPFCKGQMLRDVVFEILSR